MNVSCPSTFVIMIRQSGMDTFFLSMNLSRLRTCIRQSIVNRFVLRECRSCVPFPFKGRFVKCRSCGCNHLFECFTLSWEECCLCLLAQRPGLRTQACRLCIVPFSTGSGSIAFQTRGNVGRTTECAIEHERFPVACFGQCIVLLLASQVSKQGQSHRDIPRHSAGLYIGQGFF